MYVKYESVNDYNKNIKLLEFCKYYDGLFMVDYIYMKYFNYI